MGKKLPKRSMSDFQALVTGALMGALWRESTGRSSEGEAYLDITVEPVFDEEGYLPELRVSGNQSGEKLLIKVIQIE